MWRLAFVLIFIPAWPAVATGLTVTFLDGSPQDLFIVENTSDCDLGQFELAIDLTSSRGGSYFDATPGGMGASMSQPFAVAVGRSAIARVPDVADGDQVVRIPFYYLPRDFRVVFTADIDDQLPTGPMGETVVDGTELSGATVSMTFFGVAPVTSTFGDSGRALIAVTGCQVAQAASSRAMAWSVVSTRA
ncbi:MAG: hypothetical protein RIC16_07130 [Rhodospirillales bacterium]